MRRRMIDPSIWDDPDIGTLPLQARFLFIGCISLADDAGNILADPRYLKKCVFGYDDVSTEQVAGWLDQITALRAATVYTVEGQSYLHLNNWTRYQKLDARYAPKLTCPPFPDAPPTNAPEDTAPVDDTEKCGTVTPQSLAIEQDADKSKAKLSKAKLSKAAAAVPKNSKPEPSNNNYAQVLREYEKKFGLLGGGLQYEQFSDLWDEYPVPATHEYARAQMRQAMMRDDKPVSPNLRYYAKCLETGNQRNWKSSNGDGMNATQRRRAKQYPVADPNDPDIKRWMEEEKLRRQQEATNV